MRFSLPSVRVFSGSVAFVYVALIALSSVYLGWHYAIDGYISIVLVVFSHFLVRRLVPTGDAWRPGLARGN
jgi:membrane-associated phospholipid phosphatase